MSTPILSIIIVHYKIEPILFDCLDSIYKQKVHTPFEVIIVDNGSLPGFKKRLLKQYKHVIYVQPKKNLGYGRGNHFGVRTSKGTILFFLNPDTILMPHCLSTLLSFWKTHPESGIVAPTLLHPDKTLLKLQGTLTLTPLRAIAAHSIFHTLWPNNPLSRSFFLKGINQNTDRLVEAVPGSAFSMYKKLYEKIGGFDSHFFLYFEEYDICKRVFDNNKKIWMLGDARVIHLWGATTRNENTKKVYTQSFMYYLTKHYGTLLGTVTYMITQVSKLHLLILVILMAFFLLSLRIIL